MENADEIKFHVLVPHNDKELVQARNKRMRLSGWMFLLVLPLMIMLVVVSLITGQTSVLATSIFVGFATLILICSIVFFLLGSRKPNNNNNKLMEFVFYDYYLVINLVVKKDVERRKPIRACLYRSYGSKQYVAKIIEDATKISLKICTGSMNYLVPIYENQVISKSVLSTLGLLDDLKEFLKARVSKYIVK